MEWIGQHIWDQVSRFRQHAYFEDSVTLSTGKSITMDEYTSGTISITKIQDSGTTFNDNDTSLMTAAAIADKIEAYGYSTASGDITGVVLTADDENTVSDTGGSADFTIAGANGVTTSVDGTDFVVGGSNASTSAKGVVELATTAETTTGTDTGRAVTPDGLKDGYQGSSNVVTLGTIGTGVWNGTAIASAYLDSDTAHLSGAQTVTGVKTIGTNVKLQFRDANAYINSPDSNDIEIAATDITLDAAGTIKLEGPVRPTGHLQFTHHNFTDDIDTTKIYLSLGDADAESTTTNMPIKQPFCAPLAGKLMRVYFRCNQNLSASGGGSNCTLSWRLETVATGNGIGTTPSVIGTVSGVGPTTTALATYDFTAVTNTIAAGDMVWLSVQSDSATPNVKWFVTCLWEWDMSTIG